MPRRERLTNAVHVLMAAARTTQESAWFDVRTEVRRMVGEMRAEGVFPEIVLAQMKSNIRFALAPSRSAFALPNGTDLVGAVGQWCIAEYYRIR
jgi:hypothetical protein